jgi:hypothetical protein
MAHVPNMPTAHLDGGLPTALRLAVHAIYLQSLKRLSLHGRP